MALTWNVTQIANHETVTTSPFPGWDKKPQWHPATEALVWLSVHCGYSEIIEKNAEEVAYRVGIWESYIGATMVWGGGDLRVSEQDVRNHIGLTTNASRLSRAEFKKKVWATMEREASLGRTTVHEQMLSGAVARRAPEIEELVRTYEGLEDADAADMAADAIREDPTRDNKDIAHDLAMRIAYP